MKSTAILTADIHLREDQPVCRTDNYWDAQARKIKWLRDLQLEHNCPILDAGDLFNKWKPSPYLLQWAIKNLPQMITVAGNHDQSSHNQDLFEKTGLAVLEAAGVVTLAKPTWINVKGLQNMPIYGFPWGVELFRVEDRYASKDPLKIALVHTMTYKGRVPYPGCTDPGASTLLDKMTGFDLIVTGHNHKPFVVEKDGRLLVNSGSLMRSTSDQADHEPRVYLWYAEDNHVEPVFVPIEKGVVSRDHIDVVEHREERMTAFVSRLNQDVEIGLSFERNMERYLAANRLRTRTREILEKVVR